MNLRHGIPLCWDRPGREGVIQWRGLGCVKGGVIE